MSVEAGLSDISSPSRSGAVHLVSYRGGFARRQSLTGRAGWKSREVGPHRGAIGSPVGGPGAVRGGVRGGGGSRDGSEREEGARPRDPSGVGAAPTSAAAVGLLLWAHPPAGADGESHRAAVGGGGRSFVPGKRLALSGLVQFHPLLTWDGAVRRPMPPCFRARSGLVRGAPSVLRMEQPGWPR